MIENETAVAHLDAIEDPGCREFQIGEGDWRFRGFVVRQGNDVYAYRNYCMHVGHPLNWAADSFLTKDRRNIICSSHGAIYEIEGGLGIAGPCSGKRLNALPTEVRDGVIFVRGPAGK